MSPQELPSIAETDAVASSGLPTVLARIERQERRRRRTRRGVLVGVPSALVIAGLVAVTAPASPFSPFGVGDAASSSGVAAGSVATPEPSSGSAQPDSGTVPLSIGGSATSGNSGAQSTGRTTLICRADTAASTDAVLGASADPIGLCATLLGIPRGTLGDAAVCIVTGGPIAVFAAPATCSAEGLQPWKR